jgi:CRP-like cAMP-binding protein
MAPHEIVPAELDLALLGDLGEKELATLQALIASPRRVDAAKALGISRQALAQRLDEHPEILTALLDYRRDQVRELADDLWAHSIAAVKIIRAIADDPDAEPSVRLAAAARLVDLAVRLHETDDMQTRLQLIESAMKEKGLTE